MTAGDDRDGERDLIEPEKTRGAGIDCPKETPAAQFDRGDRAQRERDERRAKREQREGDRDHGQQRERPSVKRGDGRGRADLLHPLPGRAEFGHLLIRQSEKPGGRERLRWPGCARAHRVVMQLPRGRILNGDLAHCNRNSRPKQIDCKLQS